MKVSELIKQLSKFSPDLEVVILDGFNGGGQPRQINLGPYEEEKPSKFINPIFPIKENDRCEFESYDTSDLVDDKATKWITLGFGCY